MKSKLIFLLVVSILTTVFMSPCLLDWTCNGSCYWDGWCKRGGDGNCYCHPYGKNLNSENLQIPAENIVLEEKGKSSDW